MTKMDQMTLLTVSSIAQLQKMRNSPECEMSPSREAVAGRYPHLYIVRRDGTL